MYEASPVGITLIDPVDNRFIAVNPAFRQMVGYSEEELVTLCVPDLAHPDDRSLGIEPLQRTLAGGSDRVSLQQRLIHRSGEVVWVNIMGSVTRDGDGAPLFGLAMVENVTEKRRVEEQLLHAQKMEAVGRLAGGIAHDFNNLLQAMLTQTDMLRRTGGGDQTIGFLGELEQQIRRGAAVARQLLLFSRRETPKPERIDLNEALGKAAEMIKRLLRENIVFDLAPSDGPLVIEIDQGQLDQVLLNLVVNAADAMPEGGRLTIRSGRADPSCAWFEVIDTGHGITPEIRDRIFEPFFTTKGASHGTGLGLSVVHGIVCQIGGCVEVASKVGVGSTFRVVLPLAHGGGPHDELSNDGQDGAPKRLRVLVVEDEDGARKGLHDVLSMLGYDVLAVSSGEEAAALPERPTFHILLTDFVLPGIDGAEVARRLHRKWPQMGIIMMSGYAKEGIARQDIDGAEVRFLQKPFDMASLERELESLATSLHRR
jgi:two-component system cell cycle sensor histidine kinase/response regulator CckA